MDIINTRVVELMRAAGISEAIIDTYLSELPLHTDSLEVVGLYWAKKIAQLDVNIRVHLDICLYMRDTTSSLLFLERFNVDVIPLIRQYGIFETGQPNNG